MPVIGLVDTNADPDEADYIVPGNDDAIRACDLITRVIADGVIAGKQRVTPQEMGATRRERPATAAANGEPEAPATPEPAAEPEIAQPGVEVDAPEALEPLGKAEEPSEPAAQPEAAAEPETTSETTEES
jgi:small subunit ribosomal protein S2